MEPVSFSLSGKKRLLFAKEKYTIKDSLGRMTVTAYQTSTINNCILEGKNLIYPNVSLMNVHLGFGTYVNSNTALFNTYVGAYSSISSNVKIINGIHPSHFVTTYPGFYSNIHQDIATFADDVYFQEFAEMKYDGKYSTYIGNDVLVGSGAVLTEGVKIGDGAIILPYAVVTKDVEPYAVMGGIPAKCIKFRFDEEEREYLLKSEWWNHDEEWMRKNWKSLLNVKEFINGNIE